MFRNSDLNDILEPVQKISIYWATLLFFVFGGVEHHIGTMENFQLFKREGKFRRLKYLDMSLDDEIPPTVPCCASQLQSSK
jgi:hypothetical protein